MSKSLRSFTSLSRPLVQCRPIRSQTLTRYSHSLPNRDGGVSIQRVRFKKPSVRSRLSTALTQVTVFLVTTYSLNWYLKDEKQEHDDATTQIEEGQEEDGIEDEAEVEVPEEMPEDAIFIPLGLTRQRPPEFYKGSGPEWQSFIEFNKDRDRQNAVRKELAHMVGNILAGQKPMQKGLGTPVKVKKFWIDVIVPEGPPLEYERSGIEIAEDYIAWTTRPVSAYQRQRFLSAIWPEPVARSFWASFSTSWSLQMAKVKYYLGLGSDSASSNSALPSGLSALEQFEESAGKQSAQTPARLGKVADSKATPEANPKASPDPSSPERSRFSSFMPSLSNIGGENSAAVTKFKQTLARYWNPASPFGERGTLIMTGLVALEGPKGSCVLDIAAAYHPQEARFAHIKCGVRNYRPRYQRPRGGP